MIRTLSCGKRCVNRLLARSAVGAIAMVFLTSAPALAQLTRLDISKGVLEPGGTMRGTDVGYDPTNGVYLVVTGNGPVYGVFVNGAGNVVSAPFVIMDGGSGWAHFPRVKYTSDAGAFLVTWHQNIGSPNFVMGRMVSYVAPGFLQTPIRQFSDGQEGGTWWETGPAVAFSASSHRFLVAWRTVQYGIQGRLVDIGGNPLGGIIQLENPGGSRDPSLAWNAATDEFGLAYTGWSGNSAFAMFRRVRASDGSVSAKTTFGFGAGTFATGIDVNTSTGQYVMAWALHPGTNTAVFDAGGSLLGTSFLTSRLGFDQSLGLAFNSATGTFLAVSSDRDSLEVGALEVAGNGQPNTTAQVVTNGAALGSFHPLATSRAGTNNWNVIYSRDFRGATDQIVASGTTGGGGGSPLTGPTPTPTPAPAPAPTNGCSTPDPFVSLGGGTCVNGGWLPPGIGSPAPAPPPATPPPPPPPTNTGCTTPDPFTSLGGGTCVNGGWLPPGLAPPSVAPTPPPPSAPAPTGCSTPDPFASLGGGVCLNGGWVPNGFPGTCIGPDPFTSLGGGVCINGGWVPQGFPVRLP
jgi:hypothetical protein